MLGAEMQYTSLLFKGFQNDLARAGPKIIVRFWPMSSPTLNSISKEANISGLSALSWQGIGQTYNVDHIGQPESFGLHST